MERLLTSATSPENGPLFIALGIIVFFLVLKTAKRSYLAAPWVRPIGPKSSGLWPRPSAK